MKSVNPAKDWHHVTVRDPKVWKIVGTIQFGRRSKKTDRSDFGIQARVGKKNGKGGTKPVTLLFDPRLWTLERAKKWAKDHDETVIEAVAAPEAPDYELSGRARSIKRSRRESDAVKAYRLDLLHAGIGLEAQKVDRKRLLATAKKRGLRECVEWALKHGRFTDGNREILIVPAELAGLVSGFAGR